MRVVLPSNSSTKHFPRNSLAEYNVKLPQALDLSVGQWEVGLAEIQFFKSWFNATDAYLTVIYNNARTKVDLEDGYYDTAQTLIENINSSIRTKCSKAISDMLTYHYNEINRTCFLKVRYKVQARGLFNVEYSSSLKEILSINDDKVKVEVNIIDASDRGNITKELIQRYIEPMKLHTIFNIMVYSDIVDSSIVGDIEAQLLRVVAIEDNHWKLQCTNYNKIQYTKVNRKNISNINIYIYTDYGKKVPFTRGRTVVTLDIRKVKPINLI